MGEERYAREEICEVGLSLFSRGLTFGSTGNISVRLSDGGWLMTPTNASLGRVDPAMLSKFDGTFWTAWSFMNIFADSIFAKLRDVTG